MTVGHSDKPYYTSPANKASVHRNEDGTETSANTPKPKDTIPKTTNG